MGSKSQTIRRFVDHPTTRLAVGAILFASGLGEAYGDLTNLSEVRFGLHHGIMLLGLFNMLASLPDMIDGLSSGADYLEHREYKRNDRG